MKMRKAVLLLMLTGVLIISGSTCVYAEETGLHTVIDHSGYEIKVADEIDSVAVCDILPLSSVLTVFFDSGDIITGMSATAMAAAEGGLLGELYPELLDAETGFIDGSTVNLEELMILEPDVVFYNAARAELGEQLRNAGFAAVSVSVNKWEYDCIETLNQWIALLSEIFPNNDRTELVEQRSREMYDLVQERLEGIPEEERKQAFFLFKYSDTSIETSGKKFFGQWWADAAGLENAAETLDTDNSVSVNMEQIYQWNPDIVFITNFTSAMPEDLYTNSVGNYDWSPIDAVKEQQVYKMPLGMYRSYTPGADTPVTLLWMAKTAYPEYFSDIDIISEVLQYYQEVFGVELTEEQAESIFSPDANVGEGF